MVDVDRAGIARTAKALGGEGTNVLLLKTSHEYEGEVLDAGLPEDEGEGPANGGWFPGPKGWLLFIEGLDEQVDPWIEQLAAGLDAAGVEGTLTGAGTVPPPLWARKMADDARRLHGLIGFRPKPEFRFGDGWATGPEALEAAVSTGMGWLTAHGGKVMAEADLRAQFWATPAVAGRIMLSDTARSGQGGSSSYHQQRGEVRDVSLLRAACAQISSCAEILPWRDTVEELRSALLVTPLDHVSIAMVSHRGWYTLLGATVKGSEHYHRFAYQWHPERWDEFILEPCGIQILTGRHLAAAHDLSGWRTTRLDEVHYLVEARDLDPWFAVPRRGFEAFEPELIDQARRDFGDMILTPQRADALGLSTKPPIRN